MAKVTVDLETPLIGHTGPIKQITLREPLACDYWELGEPYAHARNLDGAIISVEKADTIKAYIERLVVDLDPLLLGQASLKDAIKISQAVVGFFSDARSS